MKKKEITRTRIRVKNIPQQLKDRKQWVCWHLEPGKEGTMTKVLYRPHGGRRRKASHSDPQTWGPFEQALACFEGDTWYTGIGVTLANGLVGVDLDGFPQQRELPAWAARHVERLNTYTEWSPSQQGIHMLALGKLPPGRRRTGPQGPHGIEMYDSQRFFTVTGDRLAGYDTLQERSAKLAALHAAVFGDADTTIDSDEGRSVEGSPDLSDEEILELARGAGNAAKFSRLWAGDAADYVRSDGTPDTARRIRRCAACWPSTPATPRRSIVCSGGRACPARNGTNGTPPTAAPTAR